MKRDEEVYKNEGKDHWFQKANRYEDAHSSWIITTARATLRHCAGGARDELLVARL